MLFKIRNNNEHSLNWSMMHYVLLALGLFPVPNELVILFSAHIIYIIICALWHINGCSSYKCHKCSHASNCYFTGQILNYLCVTALVLNYFQSHMIKEK